MPNVISFSESSVLCWLCQKEILNRALFCHHCGSVQPVRTMDHFERMGVERQIDVDREQLDRQYEILKRTLDPNRFASHGLGERSNAEKQMNAIHESYHTLHDPVRRGRYWLTVNNFEVSATGPVSALVVELNKELEDVAAPAQCDRVAQKAGLEMQLGIMNLMQALRERNWNDAQTTLYDLESIEAILTNVRSRRASLISP